MSEPRSRPPSDEPAPRSSSPTVASVAGTTPHASTLPSGITAIGLLGIVGFVLVRLTMPPEEVATECLQAALAEQRVDDADLNTAVEMVVVGKLEASGKGSKDIANGLLSVPRRRRAIEHCRAVYAKQAGLSPTLPLLQVETAVASISVERTFERANGGTPETVHDAEPGAEVSVENVPGQGSCVTSSSGRCELVLHGLAHDAKLTLVAKLTDGALAKRSVTVVELLQGGSTLTLQERTPKLELPSAPDCLAARRSLENGAQFTRIPPGAAGHELEASVDVSPQGRVARIDPSAPADPMALAALRSQLATLQGLPGPCHDLRVSLHY